MVFEEGDPMEILTLNVAGSLMQVQRCVLTQVEGSLLAAKFSGRWSGSLDSNGNIYVDIPFKIFEPLVDMLRIRWSLPEFEEEILTVDDFGGDKRLFRRFLGLVDYYGMLNTLYPVQIMVEQKCVDTDFPNDGEYKPRGVQFGKSGGITEFHIRSQLSVCSFQIDLVDPPEKGKEECKMKFGWKSTDLNPAVNPIRFFETHAHLDAHRAPDGKFPNFLGRKLLDLEGKRWVLEMKNDTVRLTITRFDDAQQVMEKVFRLANGTVWFKATGAFRLSSVQLLY